MASHAFAIAGAWHRVVSANQLALNMSGHVASNDQSPSSDAGTESPSLLQDSTWHHYILFVCFAALQQALDCHVESVMETYVHVQEQSDIVIPEAILIPGCAQQQR